MITVNTKPLLTALNLAVVNSNVSKYYKKSGIAQITVEPKQIKFNFEAENVISEVSIAGMSTAAETQVIMVDNLLLKQLISTLSSATVTLDVQPDALVITSGKSRFTVPRIDTDGLTLNVPDTITSNVSIDVDKDAWRFIKDNQMYAISMSFEHPVYRKVWVSESGDTLVGDFDTCLFTHSTKSNLACTCLLSDTIINLLNSLPEGAKMYRSDGSYIIIVVTDSYKYTAQFSPRLESDEGSYNSDIILGSLNHPDNCFAVAAATVNQILGQALLLSTSTEDTIWLKVANREMTLQNNNMTGTIDIDFDGEFGLEFKTDSLKSVMSSYGDVDVRIGPSILDDEVVGIIVWDDELTTTLAGVG